MVYPCWGYYPRNTRPAQWAVDLVAVVRAARSSISTEVPADAGSRLSSDDVLQQLRPALEELGYEVEAGKKRIDKIVRPVLFGNEGTPAVSYEIDAFHAELGIALEVEAGRGAASNAEYRDIVRTALILDARYFSLLMPLGFLTAGSVIHAYDRAKAQLDAIYASRRLVLPFDGLVLIGY